MWNKDSYGCWLNNILSKHSLQWVGRMIPHPQSQEKVWSVRLLKYQISESSQWRIEPLHMKISYVFCSSPMLHFHINQCLKKTRSTAHAINWLFADGESTVLKEPDCLTRALNTNWPGRVNPLHQLHRTRQKLPPDTLILKITFDEKKCDHMIVFTNELCIRFSKKGFSCLKAKTANYCFKRWSLSISK